MRAPLGYCGTGSEYRKSSITTRSAAPPLLTSCACAPNAPLPDVMRTRAMIGESNLMPTKENPAITQAIEDRVRRELGLVKDVEVAAV